MSSSGTPRFIRFATHEEGEPVAKQKKGEIYVNPHYVTAVMPVEGSSPARCALWLVEFHDAVVVWGTVKAVCAALAGEE